MPFDELIQGPQWMPIVRDYIEAHVHEPLRVSQLAELANVHPVYFARVFKAKSGMSVLRYVRQRKVRAASATMMGEKRVRLVDVANEFGFADQAHFSRVFREEFGASPSKFRASQSTTVNALVA